MRAAAIATALTLAVGAQATYLPYPYPAADVSTNSQINSQAVNSGVTQSAGGDKAYGGSNIGNNANFAATGGNTIEGANVNVNDRKLLGFPGPQPNIDANSQINSQAVNSGVTQSAGGDTAVWGSNIGSNDNAAFTGGNYIAATNVNTDGPHRRSLLNYYYPEGPSFSENSQINSQAANTGVTQSAGGDKAIGGSNIGSNSNVAVTGGNDLAASNFNLNGRHLLSFYQPATAESQAQQTNGQQQQTGNQQFGSVNSGGFNVAPTWNQAASGGNGQQAENNDVTAAGYPWGRK